jgi:hypothetical protein
MGNKLKYPAIIFTAIIEFLTIKAWYACANFTGIFHYSASNAQLQLEDYIYTEKDTPFVLIRLFNNKITVNFLDLLRYYLQFWDIRFGTFWFSLIGYFGILAGFYYFITLKKKKYYHWLFLLLLFILPWIEIIHPPHFSILIKSIYLWLPYCIFSFFGIYQYLTHGKFKKRLTIFIIILAVSIWWLVFLPYGMSAYCSK